MGAHKVSSPDEQGRDLLSLAQGEGVVIRMCGILGKEMQGPPDISWNLCVWFSLFLELSPLSHETPPQSQFCPTVHAPGDRLRLSAAQFLRKDSLAQGGCGWLVQGSTAAMGRSI